MAARIGDPHICPMVTPGTPPIPHVGGPVIMGAPTVLTAGVPQSRVTDTLTCVGPPDVFVIGSMGVIVCSLPATRALIDTTAHGGNVVMGALTVFIGDSGSAMVGPGGTAVAIASAGQGEHSEPLASAAAYIAPWKQAFVYRNAAKTGTAFCERCSE